MKQCMYRGETVYLQMLGKSSVDYRAGVPANGQERKRYETKNERYELQGC